MNVYWIKTLEATAAWISASASSGGEAWLAGGLLGAAVVEGATFPLPDTAVNAFYAKVSSEGALLEFANASVPDTESRRRMLSVCS